jgi:hypothetical protein
MSDINTGATLKTPSSMPRPNDWFAVNIVGALNKYLVFAQQKDINYGCN